MYGTKHKLTMKFTIYIEYKLAEQGNL